MTRCVRVTFAALVLCVLTSAHAAERGGMDETGPYQVVENWFKPGVERWNQVVTSVAVDTPNRIIVGSGDEHMAQPGSLILNAEGIPLNQRRDAKVPDKPDSERTHLHQILVLNGDG